MNCNKCGGILPPGASTCPQCGNNISTHQQPMMNQQQPTQQPMMNQGQPIQQPMMNQGQSMMNQQPMMNQPQPMQQPMMNQPLNPPYNGNGPKGEKSKAGAIITILVVTLLVLLLGGYLLKNNFKSENKEPNTYEEYLKEEEKKEKEEEKLKTKVKIEKEIKLQDGSILFQIKNESSKTIRLDMEIELYDANNQFLGTETLFTRIAPSSISYNILSSYSLEEGYVTHKINMDVRDYSDDIEIKRIKTEEITANMLDNKIAIQYNNKTQKTIDQFDVMVLFYSGDNIVHIEEDFDYDVEPDSNANFSISLYSLEYDNVTYDRYEIIAEATIEKPLN